MKAVVFDLDDTLYPEQEFALSGFRVVAEWLNRRIDAPDFFVTAQQLFQAGTRGNIFDVALKKCGLEHESALIPQMIDVFRIHLPQIEIYPDARLALNFCQNRFQIGIITDGYAQTQRNKIAALNLESLVDVIVYSDDLGRENWKPSPVPYRRMEELLRVSALNCMYIGDNPDKDFVTAKKLGWTTLRVIRAEGEHATKMVDSEFEADLKLTSLSELPELLLVCGWK